MESFRERFVDSVPEAYYILTSPMKIGDHWRNIESIITDEYVYFPNGAIAVYSSLDKAKRQNKGKPFELACLSCFYHIMRLTMRLRSSVVDNKFHVRIKPWRAPCESTAVYTDKKGETYCLEGCRGIGVFWRSKSAKPRTEPPFVSCGAFDTNAGCWGEECPHGYYFADEEEPFL